MPQYRIRDVAAGIAIFLACLLCALPARGAPPATWRTGDDFRRQLSASASITWSENPLGAALASLAAQWRIAIWLDRRVDPEQAVDFTISDQPLDTCLRELAASRHLGVAYVDSLVYIGPPAAADVLDTLAELRFDEAQALPADWRDSLSRRADWKWDELAEPRELLQQLVRDNHLSLLDRESIPHDLWPARELPALPLTHCLSLVLVGFGKSYTFDAAQRQLRIVDMPATATLARDYPLKGTARGRLAELRRQFPAARLETAGERLRVLGSAEDHYWIRRSLLGLPSLAPRAGTPTDTRYTLRAANRFDVLAKALAQRLGVQVEFAPDIEAKVAQQVTLEVKEATRDELLQALVDTVGLHYELRGKLLRIVPRK